MFAVSFIFAPSSERWFIVCLATIQNCVSFRDPVFEPRPSLQMAVDYVVTECVRKYPMDTCSVCDRTALPHDPQVMSHDPQVMSHDSKFYWFFSSYACNIYVKGSSVSYPCSTYMYIDTWYTVHATTSKAIPC